MSVGTELARASTFDLTRAPQERWNQEMVKVVAKNVFRGREITEPQLYYCLSVAESVELNPLIGEIYFLPSKSNNAEGPAWLPYIGRNGLVNKAERHHHYYEADTVHERDRFRMTRKKDGTVEVTHSYTQAERGEIVGAYAFLHDRTGVERPAFFYAKLSEYLPTYDAEWKMAKSVWGNQRSAMIEKCAMIGAGRKRLQLGNVLADGEIARVQQMQAITGPPASDVVPGEFDWQALAGRVGEAEAGQLREAVEFVHELDPEGWPPAKLEMVTGGMHGGEVLELAEQIRAEAHARVQSLSPEQPADPDQPPAEGPDSPGGAGSVSEEPIDAVVVPDAEHIAGLRLRQGKLEARLADGPWDEREQDELTAELEGVTAEIAAAENPDQGSLL
jgi:hypothetical protein